MSSCFSGSDYKLQRNNSKVAEDGRADVSIDKRLQAKLLRQFHRDDKKAKKSPDEAESREPKKATLHWRTRKDDFQPDLHGFEGVPRMNIAILITGSRGDVQPFIALGNVLQKCPYNHRVRICTHPNFKDFVTDNGLEFYSIGGDPEKLMSYMVRNPGVIPSFESMKAGDVGDRREEIAEMLEGCWRACTQAGNGMDPIKLPETSKISSETIMKLPDPFVADAIISNPPAYANIHIAEKLAVPLHMVFTMPWSPTTAFAHPLANLDTNKGDRKLANYLSYYSMELLTSEGLIDLINDFRENTLALDPLHAAWAHQLLPQLKVPFTYCWSPALIPKPEDWGSHITISGFLFMDPKKDFEFDADLKEFLDAGEPPVYIGFGSIVVDDPEAMTKMILDAVKQLGIRALVSKGWGGIGGEDVPDNVFLLGNVPHDQLFPHCSAVVHHGGAGTNAIGISLGCPTVVVPFFGDQPWWGEMIHRAGAGPSPIPYKDLDADKLANQIREALKPETKERAKELAARIKEETGAKTAAKFFHETQQMQDTGCFLCPDQVAVYRVRRTNIRLSALATGILVDHGILHPQHLKLIRKKRWYVEKGAQEPVIGILGAIGTTGVGYKNCFSRLGKDLHANKAEKSPSHVMVGDAEAAGEVPGALKAVAKFTGSMGLNTLRFPVDLLYNVANGCHNLPWHFFNDDTVRVRGEISGVMSGTKVGFQELVFGFYDAFTGVVTQPVRGYKKHSSEGVGAGAWGATKGVGKGLVGLVSKSSAAALGVPGYGFKGLERSVRNGWKTNDTPNENSLALLNALRGQGQRSGDEQLGNAALSMVSQAQGNSIRKQLRGRRGWQCFMDLQHLRQNPDKAAAQEEEVLRRWDELKVPKEFTRLEE
ncbi:UDP-Glycosyltransferase/glycogen phosphorylase [Aureobasidium pullulans]|nr:UDP-Glycosyltransferase/glycogen phosphorylase [Aureobasidium pullulans]